MYGTLINGIPLPAPNPLHIDGAVIYNPPDSIYAAAGYLPIMETPRPRRVRIGHRILHALLGGAGRANCPGMDADRPA